MNRKAAGTVDKSGAVGTCRDIAPPKGQAAGKAERAACRHREHWAAQALLLVGDDVHGRAVRCTERDGFIRRNLDALGQQNILRNRDRAAVLGIVDRFLQGRCVRLIADLVIRGGYGLHGEGCIRQIFEARNQIGACMYSNLQAVRGAARVFKRVRADRVQPALAAAADGDGLQICAVEECLVPDLGQAVRQFDRGDRHAVERVVADGFHAFRYRDACETVAPCKRIAGNILHLVADRHACDVGAEEGPNADLLCAFEV